MTAADRGVHIVDIESEEPGVLIGMACGVVGAQPVDEVRDLDIAPHPLRKASERGATADMVSLVPDVAVDARRIGPIRLDRHDIEAVSIDEPTRDLRTRPIKFGRAVGCLAEQHHPCLGEAVEHRAERRIVQIGQRLRRLAEQFCRRRSARRRDGPSGPEPGESGRGIHGGFGPSARAYQRYERDRPEVLLVVAVFAVADDLDQSLCSAEFADWDDQAAADFQLAA